MVEVRATRFRAMELITILNRCHRFRGFVYQHAHFSAARKSIEVAVRPRTGSALVCSRCHLPARVMTNSPNGALRRVDFRRCGVVAVEEVPWAMANAH